jgi:protein disulfide-isomerase
MHMSYLVYTCRLVVLGRIILGSGSVARAEDMRWHRDYRAAQAEALRLNRTMMIVVTSKDCGWCRRLESTTLRDARVVRELKGFAVPFRLDADDPTQAGLVVALGVAGLPTIAFVNPAGRLIAKQSGYLAPEKLIRFVRDVREPRREGK